MLAGHSHGGLIARLTARLYPSSVSGLVLIDALNEGLQDGETATQWQIQRDLIAGDDPASIALYPALERLDVDGSFAQMRVARPLHPMPLVVLSADRPLGLVIAALIAEPVLHRGGSPISARSSMRRKSRRRPVLPGLCRMACISSTRRAAT